MAEEGEKIITVNIEEQMKSAYIDYSMSVIVSRALPDIRDGLKPVHRRVLFGMYELGVMSNRPYKKSARIVGEVLGKYHPHGDTSVYDAMVRMAQDWSLRYPLVDGQGNFGSIDGDSPAAMRYTEARLRKIAEEMLADIDKETVDFKLNFDDTLEEPVILPTKIPNLLVNGTSGIAVGMATNMPPHNLSQVIDGIMAFIDNNDITIAELMQHIKAPDFPYGGIIYGYEGVKNAFETGRGRIILRANTNIEPITKEKEAIIATSVPYLVNKSEMIKKTADLVNEKLIEGISDIRDESDRNGIRIVYDLKRDAVANVVLNNLFKYTQLQSTFSVNNIALVNKRPVMLNLRDLVKNFVEHRHEIVIRRTKYELKEAEKRAHILEGLLIAVDNIDAVIKLIKSSATPDDAKSGLMEAFALTEIQAKAILEMRLQRLTGLEREKIKEEHIGLVKQIKYFKEILADVVLRMKIIKEELAEIKSKYGDAPKTEIVYTADDFRIEDTIVDEAVVITISHLGYIKRTPLTEYRRQNRGGRGSKGSDSRDEDYIEHLFTATNHNYMLFFTESGKCFWLKVYEIPEGARSSKGRAIQNLLSIEPNDKIKAYINVKNLEDKEYIENNYIIMCTKKGVIKKTKLEAFSRPRQNGIIAITVKEGDHLIEAKMTGGKDEIVIALKSGRAIRFNESKVRPMGRSAGGVRGIRMNNPKDEAIGMVCVEDSNSTLLVVSENGYGKRTKVDDYRVTNRGGKGVKTINITDKTGCLIAIQNVIDTDDLMIINKSGIIIRMAVADLRIMGRATQGVRLINLKDEDAIASVTKVVIDEESEDELQERVKPLPINEEELETIEPDEEEETDDSAENDEDIEEESDEEDDEK
ncbi:MAG: DNA gyrase subunit A [Bacteroidales bacterium]|nr:DNA gyrase subunit A [Bacteroidales bacterium]